MKSIIALLLIASVAYGQTIVNIIQFSDDYCLCPNQQKLSIVDECLPVLGGYQVFRYAEGTPAQVYIQDCSDKNCDQCVNQTIYNALPPCQADKSGLFFYSVLPEDDVTTYFNAPSVVTSRYANSSCGGDVVHLEIQYGLSCFVTAEGSYYYSCPEDDTTQYSYFNCSDTACQECEEYSTPTEQCVNDEGVWKSVQCTASSSTTTTSATAATATNGQTAATATNGGNTNNNVNSASASVSTTTSASSHNVSSSASAAGTAGSATSGGAVHAIYSDVRGGMMKKKEVRANPPFCNGGVPQTSAAASTAATAGTAGTAGSATGGSSGGMKKGGGIPFHF